MIFNQKLSLEKPPLCLTSIAGLSVVAFILMLEGCSLIEAPSVQDLTFRSPQFSHQRLTESCGVCHKSSKPSPDHGLNQDCVTCHQSGAGLSWLVGVQFSHTPAPTQCVSCHEEKRPQSSQTGITHGSSLTDSSPKDCVECHRPGESWKNLITFTHNPVPTSCAACHEVNRPTKTSHFITQDCVNCHQPRALGAGGFQFTHTNANGSPVTSCSGCHEQNRKSLDHHAGEDCAHCHTDLGQKWAFSSPHPSNLAIISCNGCHEKDRKTNTLTPVTHQSTQGHFSAQDCISCHEPKSNTLTLFTFKHGANSKPIQACSTCHEGERPSQTLTLPNQPQVTFSHLTSGTGDCISCHSQSTATWLGGVFGHTPAPSTCTTCHVGQRPANATNGFSHTQAGECATCHATSRAWTSASYAHPANQASCSVCHEAKRPAANHYAGQDCVACHTQAGNSWAPKTPHPQNTNVTTCNSCHSADRKATTQYPSPGTLINGHFSTTDCNSCHVAKTAQVTQFLFSHNANGNVRTTCLPCHDAKRPVTVIQSFSHQTAGMGDCISCHQSTSVWTAGTYTHVAGTASCNSCHSNDKPATARYPNGSTVNGHYAAKDCAICHLQKSVTITAFTFGHTNYASTKINFCLPCHLSQGQNKHSGSGSVSFTGDGNCYNCHNIQKRSWNAN